MKGKLKKIDNPRYSRNGDVQYIRLRFTLESGDFAMTDLVSSFRNFARWKPIIASGIGTVVDGLWLINKSKINADSDVRIVKETLFKHEEAQQAL